MIAVADSFRLATEGPHSLRLVVDTPEEIYSFVVTDALLRDLDSALQPWRDHMAEGERVRREYRAHRGAGYCTGWVPGRGPCMLTYGHEGPHSRRMILEEGEEV